VPAPYSTQSSVERCDCGWDHRVPWPGHYAERRGDPRTMGGPPSLIVGRPTRSPLVHAPGGARDLTLSP